MTPAAFIQTDTPRDAFTATRLDQGALRAARSPRRLALAFTGDAQPALFHAWRP